MQTPKNKKIYIPAIVVLIAILAVAISPISTAVAQESSEEQSPDHSSDEKTYDGKEGKSCADKKKDRAETTSSSDEQT